MFGVDLAPSKVILFVYPCAILYCLFLYLYFGRGQRDVPRVLFAYHTFCSFFWSLTLLADAPGVHKHIGKVEMTDSPEGRSAVLMTQLFGSSVFAYALISFYLTNPASPYPKAGSTPLFAFQLFAMVAQTLEGYFKLSMDPGRLIGPILNTHHCLILLLGMWLARGGGTRAGAKMKSMGRMGK